MPSFDKDSFASARGEHFKLCAAHEPKLLLAEVRDLGGDSVREDRKPFSLLFHDVGAGVDQAQPQAIYALEHPRLGQIELFLVCLGPDLKVDGRPLVYEAIFT
jgi:hypothetical protein